MARCGAISGLGTLCVVAFLIAPFPSFGGESANSMAQGLMPATSDGSAPLHDDSRPANGYLVQASSDDVVMCSYVSKVVICHRIVRTPRKSPARWPGLLRRLKVPAPA
jgi:hypothetical protein